MAETAKEETQQGKGEDTVLKVSDDEKKTQDPVSAAEALPVTQKLQARTPWLVTLQEVQELCRTLRDAEKGDLVAVESLKQYFSSVENQWNSEEVERVFEEVRQSAALRDPQPQAEEAEEGSAPGAVAVSCETIFVVFHGEAMHAIFGKPEGEGETKNEEGKEEEATEDIQVNRDAFADVVNRAVVRNDALLTFPITFVYFVLFVFIVGDHLMIYERQAVETPLKDWVNGRDPWTQADRNVDNMETFWEWAIGVGVPGALGTPYLDAHSESTQYELASRQTLAGGIRMSCETFGGEEYYQWLLSTSAAEEVLRTNGTDKKLEAAIAGAEYLRDNGWSSRDIERIYFQVMTYNNKNNMFALTQNYVWLDRFGRTDPIIQSKAACIFPYTLISQFVVDTLFLLITLHTLRGEGKEMLMSARLGCGEFKDYWQIWNIVDWMNISLSILLCAAWLGTCNDMLADPIRKHLDKDGYLRGGTLDLSEAEVETFFTHVQVVMDDMLWLRYIMTLATMSVVAKFFKAFNSNPRLKVVGDTFYAAEADLVHFVIVFATLFLPFAILGHIIFGNDIDELCSVSAAMVTCVSLLLGDYGWYVDLTAGIAPRDHLPSGLPLYLLFLWFTLFHMFLTLTVLNMLLGIVFEHYTVVTQKVLTEPDAPPIWEQVKRYLAFRKDTRKHQDLTSIDALLQNDDDPAHPEPDVTQESLMEAFNGMTEENADWLMAFLQKDIALHKKQEEEAESHHHVSDAAILPEVEIGNSSALEVLEIMQSKTPYKVLESNVDKMVKYMTKLAKETQTMRSVLEAAEAEIEAAAKRKEEGKPEEAKPEDSRPAEAKPEDVKPATEAAASPKPSPRGPADGGAVTRSETTKTKAVSREASPRGGDRQAVRAAATEVPTKTKGVASPRGASHPEEAANPKAKSSAARVHGAASHSRSSPGRSGDRAPEVASAGAEEGGRSQKHRPKDRDEEGGQARRRRSRTQTEQSQQAGEGRGDGRKARARPEARAKSPRPGG